jgi:integrase
MSICKVENFYDSIRRYHTVKEVTERTKIELEYLNKLCGTTASLKRYLTMYRNYLKDKISDSKLVENQSLIKLLLSTLILSYDQQKEFKKAHNVEVSEGQSNLRKIYDVEKYINVSIGLLDAVSVYDRIIGLCALTGRRPAEIATSAVFSTVDNNERQAIFTGQLKVKDRIDIAPYNIPLLYDYEPIAKTLTSIREAKPQFIGNPLLFNGIASSELSARVKKHFSGLIEGTIKLKNLRAIYALLAFDLMKKQITDGYITVSMNSYFSKILGHSEDDVVTCGSYIDFCLPIDNKN